MASEANFILGRALEQRRPMSQALADARAKYERRPTTELARFIEHLAAEIEERRKDDMTDIPPCTGFD